MGLASLVRRHLRQTRLGQRRTRARWCSEFDVWVASGRPGRTPYLAKVNLVTDHGRRYHLGTLIETGTYLGEMVASQLGRFSQIVSIELDDTLHRRATRRFRSRREVRLIRGDSAIELPRVCRTVDGPALFWLDAHYSGGITARGNLETPIMQELLAVLTRHQDDVILIDDADHFDGSHDYPTVSEVEVAVQGERSDMRVDVVNNVICITPTTGRDGELARPVSDVLATRPADRPFWKGRTEDGSTAS